MTKQSSSARETDGGVNLSSYSAGGEQEKQHRMSVISLASCVG